jgi:hypothetical protein
MIGLPLDEGSGGGSGWSVGVLALLKNIQDGMMTACGRGSILKSRLLDNAVTNDMKLMNIAITHMRQAMPQPNSNRCRATGGVQQGLYGQLIRKTARRIRQSQISHTMESHIHAVKPNDTCTVVAQSPGPE